MADGPSRRTLTTACPLDCPDACSLEGVVEDGRLVALDGSERNPLTAGLICAKVRRFADHLYGDARLRHPAMRSGPKGEGRFRPVSWDEALGRVAAELQATRREHGGEAILPVSYGGSNGLLTQDNLDARLFHRLGAARLARTVCAAPSSSASEGLYGRMPGIALEDYEHAELIVLWGVNPSASSIHLVPVVKRAQQSGAKLVVIDPRRIPLAKNADLHLAPRPGTDLVIALALIRWLFEAVRADLSFLHEHATGADELRRRAEPWTFARASEISAVPPEQLQAFAQLYADSSPAALRCGWGTERNRNGGSAIAAILALPAVAGKFGVRGGGYTMSNSRAWPIDGLAAACERAPDTRTVNMNRLGVALTDGSTKLLFSYNCNPLATMPNQQLVRAGLEREDLFTVVFDQVMTDTARYADVVLPATTFLEHEELAKGYGAMVLNQIDPIVDPVGEARPNVEVFGELCERLGLNRPGEPRTAAEVRAAVLGTLDDAAAVDRALGDGAIAFPAIGPRPIQFVDIFPHTNDGKIQLCPPALDAEAPSGLYHYRADPGTERYPLALISPATSRTTSSTFGQLHRKQVALEIHPADAGARGLGDGDEARVYNEYGEVRCRARLNPDLRPGVTLLPKGLWSHHTQNGNTANALAPDALADLGGGATFNDARVQVERLDPGVTAPCNTP